MATPVLLPSRKRSALTRVVDLQRVSKPQLSILILVSTVLVIALVLLIWLLLWIMRARVGVDGWWIAQRGLAAPVVGFQGDDLRRIVRASGRTPADVGDRSFEQALRGRLAAAGRRPVLVYLSAVGVADDQGAFLLRPEPGSLQAFANAGARQWLVTPERLVELFAGSPSPKKLLILDAGQVGSDRNLGVYANGFLHRLKTHLEAKPVRGLVVLSSCAPGQVSWVSETDQSSVFGHFVALGLSGAASGWDPDAHGLTVRGLGRYVRHHVARWTAASRQAEQTPELFGDPTTNFALPRSKTSRTAIATPARDPKETERLLAKLDEAWARRDALQGRRPFRHTPLKWQRYLETLLHAERLIRTGDYGEADELLGHLPTLEKGLADASGGLSFDRFWSLGLLDRDVPAHPNDPRHDDLKAVRERIDDALRELSGAGEEAVQALDDEPAPEPSDLPAQPDPAAKPDAPVPADPKAKPDAATKVAEAGPSSPPVDSKKSASGSSKKSASGSSRKRKAGAEGKSAIPTLIDPVDRGRPAYVEAQLIVWADTFAKRSGVPYAFKGPRGELLEEAVRVRMLAEQAAASDERISRWIMPLVEAGDDLRRRAQDGLFAADARKVESLHRLLDEARARDRQAVEVAERCARALDLVEQIEAELPYFGEWKARRPGRRDDGLDADLLALIAASTRLSRALQADPADLTSRRPGPDSAEVTPEAALERVKEWEPTYREVKDAWERLQAEFQAQASSLATAGGAGRWREVDRLLLVPFIPSAVRSGLLRRVRSIALASSLTGHEEAPPVLVTPSSGSAPTDFQSYARQQSEKAIASRLPTGREDRSVDAISDGPSSADPDFWNQALALARLDWALLEFGGTPSSELSRLESSFDAARNSVRGDPAAAFEAFERLSRLIRALRAERFQAAHQSHATTYTPLAVADRAVRLLPLAETFRASDSVTETLDRFNRQALLLWHGRRLLRDFAPEHAMRLFENAQHVFDTEALGIAANEAAAMSLSKIGIAPAADGALVVSEWNEQPMDVSVTTSGSVPRGDSVVLIGYGETEPLAVTEKLSRQGARTGVLLPLIEERKTHPIEYLVQRTESTYQQLKIPLSPGVFYRGRYFPSDRAVDVTLEPAHDPVSVTIQQSYQGLDFKDFTDQFKEHPGQGYLHYGTNLKYRLVLTSDRPLKLWVRYGLEEHPESFQVKQLDVNPNRRGEIHDYVKGNDFPIVKANQQLDIAPVTLQVTVFKDRINGEIMGKGRYPFRMIPPPQYISVSADFDPGTRLLYLDVVHLANDPVTGPVKVYASIGGSDLSAWIRRSRFVTFPFQVPPGVKKIRWRVGVESMPGAFQEELETPSLQGEEPGKPPAL